MLCCLFCLSGPAKQESIEERERRGILCCISRGDASLLVWSTNSVLCSSPNLCVSWWNWKAAAFFTALYPTSMSTHRSDSMSKTRLFSFASHLAFQLLLLPLYIMLSFWLRVALYQIYLLYCFASNLCVCVRTEYLYICSWHLVDRKRRKWRRRESDSALPTRRHWRPLQSHRYYIRRRNITIPEIYIYKRFTCYFF